MQVMLETEEKALFQRAYGQLPYHVTRDEEEREPRYQGQTVALLLYPSPVIERSLSLSPVLPGNTLVGVKPPQVTILRTLKDDVKGLL